MKQQPHRTLTVITALWVIGMLIARVQMQAVSIRYPFLATRYFLPEITVAAIFAMFLPAVWMRRRWISPVLVALAALLLVLLMATGFTDLWFVSFLLLLFLAHVVRPVMPRSASRSAHPTMWGLLVWAARLGYLGGQRAARSVEPQIASAGAAGTDAV